jgi:hypothetical protein
MQHFNWTPTNPSTARRDLSCSVSHHCRSGRHGRGPSDSATGYFPSRSARPARPVLLEEPIVLDRNINLRSAALVDHLQEVQPADDVRTEAVNRSCRNERMKNSSMSKHSRECATIPRANRKTFCAQWRDLRKPYKRSCSSRGKSSECRPAVPTAWYVTWPRTRETIGPLGVRLSGNFSARGVADSAC